MDNAHGAYLRFLTPSRHPLDLGADLCCDSAHKTLPVLTGGAYLHISQSAPPRLEEAMKDALALFGSTSPSYLTLASLDLCNRYLAEGYETRLKGTVKLLDGAREKLRAAGWQVEESDPLRLTLSAPQGTTGQELAAALGRQGVECEYADRDFLVLMATPENAPGDLDRLAAALGRCPAPPRKRPPPAPGPGRAGVLRPAGGLRPPGDGGGLPVPGADLRAAHGGLPSGSAHRRGRGTDHPGGAGALHLLRNQPSRCNPARGP